VLIAADGENVAPLVQDGNATDPVWSADGTRVLFLRVGVATPSAPRTSDLWTVRVVEGKPDGLPELVKTDMPRLLGVTQSGGYFYAPNSGTSNFYVVDIDPTSGQTTSRPRRLTTSYDNRFYGASWSPDGNELAYFAERGGEPQLVLRSSASGKELFVTLTGLPKYVSIRNPPLWSSDGKSLAVRIGRAVQEVDVQSGASKQLIDLKQPPFNTENSHARLRLTVDRRTVFYTSTDASTRLTRLIRQNLDGGPSAELYLGGNIIGGPSLSPDGATLAFSTSSGFGTKTEYWAVMTIPVNGGEAKEICRMNDHTLEPIWSKDGKRLFFATYNNPPRNDRKPDIWSVPIEGGQPKPLGLGLYWKYFFDISPDGKHLVFMDENFNNELWVMRNLFPAPKKSK
jgi:Tol biopolymer transport system component